jgi:hypothetical protein
MRFNACRVPFMNDMTQTPVRFGPASSLVGTVTSPALQVPATAACLMFNMGANHRVGPRRINVKLAHVLAGRGVSSLRFDLGGVGDSDASDFSSDLHTRAMNDLRAGMDLLENTLGIRQFVIVAMCSGVEHAITVAEADTRVMAVSLFDGFAFPERRARWERTLRRALAAPAHPAFAGKAKRWLQRHLLQSHSTKALPGFFTERKSPEVNAAWFGTAMKRLVERKVAVQLLYSGSLHVSDRDRDQLGPFRREPFAQAVQYEFMRELDHTFCTAKGQQLFLHSVGDWVAACAWGAGTERRTASPTPPVAERPLRGAYVPQ